MSLRAQPTQQFEHYDDGSAELLRQYTVHAHELYADSLSHAFAATAKDSQDRIFSLRTFAVPGGSPAGVSAAFTRAAQQLLAHRDNLGQYVVPLLRVLTTTTPISYNPHAKFPPRFALHTVSEFVVGHSLRAKLLLEAKRRMDGSASTTAGVAGGLPEKAVKRYMKHVLQGLAALHRVGVGHHGLSLDSVVVETSNNVAKLEDAGFTAKLDVAAGCRANLHFCSPEQLQLVATAAPIQQQMAVMDQHRVAIDIWQAGALAFYLLVEDAPYSVGRDQQQTPSGLAGVPDAPFAERCRAVLSGIEAGAQGGMSPFAGMRAQTQHISPAAQAFVARMLALRPEQRGTVEELLAHDFITGASASGAAAPTPAVAATSASSGSGSWSGSGMGLRRGSSDVTEATAVAAPAPAPAPQPAWSAPDPGTLRAMPSTSLRHGGPLLSPESAAQEQMLPRSQQPPTFQYHRPHSAHHDDGAIPGGMMGARAATTSYFAPAQPILPPQQPQVLQTPQNSDFRALLDCLFYQGLENPISTDGKSWVYLSDSELRALLDCQGNEREKAVELLVQDEREHAAAVVAKNRARR